ncbi:MAG: TonB-dependent receptor [Pseudomonadota bacterium]
MTDTTRKLSAAMAVMTGLAMPANGWAEDAVSIDIPSQPLVDAIAELGSETGLQIIAPHELVAPLESAAVSGSMTPKEALTELLTGTGLDMKSVSATSVIIAQNADPNAETFLDPIVVQGELQTRSLQDTQTSVAVITGEELERRSDTSLRSVAERTAGVSTSARGIGFVIRGVDERGVDANGPSAPAITTSIDGARITDFGRINTTFLSTWDLEQVEILRGPQSTQSGRNALAGAVIVRSQDPTYEQEFKLRGSAGNFQTLQGAFAVNQPIIEDTVAVRVSGDFNSSDGFIDNITTGADDDGGVENINLRGSVRFDPAENFWGVLKLSYIEGTDEFASSEEAFFPDRINVTDAPTRDEFDYRTVNLRMGYDFSDTIAFESETVFVDREFTFLGDFDGTGLPLATASDTSTGQSFSQEIKLLYEDERIKGVIGGFFLRSDETSETAGNLPGALLAPPQLLPFISPTATVTGSSTSSVEVQNFAVFGEAEIEVIENFTFIAGGRYDRETQDRLTIPASSTNDPFLAALLPPDVPEATSTTFDAFLPKAGVVYDFTDDLSLGFTYQRGYRSGGAGVNLAQNEQFEFDPEFTNNYELSLRSQWWDDRVTLNANAYYVTFTDQQVVVELSSQPLDEETQNAGSSKSFGGELEARAEPIPGLELFGAIGYNETEFTDFISNGQQLAGNEFRNAPRWTGSVGGAYFFENGFFVGADASYTAASFGDALNNAASRSDPRFLLNLRAGYEGENFGIFAFVDNVTDVTYAEERSATSSLVTIGDPLTFGLVGQVNF